MKLGLVGLGRMGGGIAERLRRDGHEVVGYDRDPAHRDVASLEELVAALEPPRVVWLMVPAGTPTEQTFAEVCALLEGGDIVVDGGNSWYRDSIRRGKAAEEQGLRFIDCGTSGGIWGLENGFCLMVGGAADAVAVAEPLFTSLAPTDGYGHVGPVGAGHYVKMVHNGIEYGLMQAYAEGFALLKAYDEPVDLAAVSALWNHGSVVRSWLLELAEHAFAIDPDLEQLQAYVDDSGEGRWTVQEAIERAVPAHVLATALFDRFDSRDDNPFAMRVLAALRNEFGGHAVRPA